MPYSIQAFYSFQVIEKVFLARVGILSTPLDVQSNWGQADKLVGLFSWTAWGAPDSVLLAPRTGGDLEIYSYPKSMTGFLKTPVSPEMKQWVPADRLFAFGQIVGCVVCRCREVY